MPRLRILEVHGTHYEMGYQHGIAYANAIRELTHERVALCSDEAWTGRSLPTDHVLELAQACLEEHYTYAPELMEQLEGIAKATDLALPQLLIANGFTDLSDTIYNALERVPKRPIYGNECTAFFVGSDTAAEGKALLGQTWDMHATATPYVLMLHGKPKGEPDFMAFTLTGCVAMIGMNEAGIAVGINNLASANGQVGVTWPFVCRKVLMQDNLEDALACITSARLAGGHNYILADATGRAYNVEAMPTVCHVEAIDVYAHANICHYEPSRADERALDEEWVHDSTIRIRRAEQYLNQQPVTVETLMTLTRDRSDDSYSVCSMSEPPFYSETCGAVIMRPHSRELWGVWGLPNQNEYERLSL